MTPLLSGYRVHVNPHLVVPGDIIQVPRTWRERLLTRPWRPWVGTKPQQTFKPDPSFYVISDGTIVMHPEVYARFLTEVNKSGAFKDKRQDV